MGRAHRRVRAETRRGRGECRAECEDRRSGESACADPVDKVCCDLKVAIVGFAQQGVIALLVDNQFFIFTAASVIE